MKSDKIREQKLEGAGGVNYSAHYERDCAIFLRELAAQTAELNEKLAIVLNPPIGYDMSKIDPSALTDFPKLPQPITMRFMEPRATLRDQFAMAALTGNLNLSNNNDPQNDSVWAYKYADAMMEARK